MKFSSRSNENLETQLVLLQGYTQARNFEVITEFKDYDSVTSKDRTPYKLMMAVVKKRKIDVVLVWRYDRFARSTQALVNALKKFQSLGIDIIYYQENIDTTIPTEEFGVQGQTSHERAIV